MYPKVCKLPTYICTVFPMQDYFASKQVSRLVEVEVEVEVDADAAG
jgi:hypothetical protein